MILYVLATVMLRKKFPEDDWQEYFTNSPGDNHKLNIKKYYIYLVMAVQCLISVCCLTIIDTHSLNTVIAVAIGFSMLYWTMVICVILMIDYKKETLTIIMEQQYRNEMQSFMNVIRSQRHDYNFHVQTLAGMINNGNLESCRKYVNELVTDSIAMNAMLPVKDPAISAMINNFRILAAREGIELHIDIQNDLANVVTNVYETNKIISNLLQNAIDEVKTHKDKAYGIWLYIFKRGEFCNIHVANELEEDVPQEDYVMNIYKQGYTTKLGHDGIGLSSIQTLAKRYKGLIYTYLEGNVIHFIAEIPIRI
jgi:sensor histidine kinase regulating citrate/malate metabolism